MKFLALVLAEPVVVFLLCWSVQAWRGRGLRQAALRLSLRPPMSVQQPAPLVTGQVFDVADDVS